MANEQPNTCVLCLFIAGVTAENEALAERFRQLLSTSGAWQVQVELVDVFDDPERAQQTKVFVTPTLVKFKPEPPDRVIGDLHDPEKALRVLGLHHGA